MPLLFSCCVPLVWSLCGVLIWSQCGVLIWSLCGVLNKIILFSAKQRGKKAVDEVSCYLVFLVLFFFPAILVYWSRSGFLTCGPEIDPWACF